jgi:hypothetical protein
MQSPFEKTLLLDTDTYVCADISDLFAILERFDIALTHERPYRDDFPFRSGVSEAFVEFNQGVITFRRSYEVQNGSKGVPELGGEARHEVRSTTVAARVVPQRSSYSRAAARIQLSLRELRLFERRCPNSSRTASESSHAKPRLERVARTLNLVTVPRVFLIGAVFAMSKNAMLGRVYWTRTLIGRLYRPYIALSDYALSSLRNGIREEGLGRWLLRMAKRAFRIEQ